MLIFEKIKVFLNFRQTRFGWVFFHRKFYRNKFSLQYSLLLRQDFQYRNSDVIAIFSKRLYTIVLCLKLILKLYRKLVSYLLQTETLKKFWRKKTMENLILSLVAPIGLTLFRAGQSQSKNLVKSLTKPFFHLSIGEYQISFSILFYCQSLA